MESGKSPARAALLGVLVFFCVGLAVVVGVIIYSKETAPPAPPPAVDEEYLARKKAEAEERAASKAGAEEAKKKWREEKASTTGSDEDEADKDKPTITLLSRRASRLKTGMRLAEAKRTLGADPIGSCLSSLNDGAKVYVWDNGPKHTLVKITMRGAKITGWDEGRLEDEYVRKLQLQTHLKGGCNEDDPK